METPQDLPPIVLGSTSPWRRRVMAGLGIPFTPDAPDLDEPKLMAELEAAGFDIEDIVLAMAEAKAAALWPRYRDRRALIVTGDQLVSFDGVIRCKPADADEARAFLRSYRGKAVDVVSAVTMLDSASGLLAYGTELSVASYGDLPDAAIEAAIAGGDVLRSCGAVVVEDPAVAGHVRLAQGTSDAMSGLPLQLLLDLFVQHGYRFDR